MEVGQVNNLKIGAIIQARLSSTRLPNKVLMDFPIGSNKPLLKSILDGLGKSNLVSQVFIAAPKKDILIQEFAQKENVIFFGGSENDVFSRFYTITKSNDIDIVIRLTGDNPFIDGKLLDEAILNHVKNKVDYTYTSGLPLGCNFEIISGKALLLLKNQELDKDCLEHVTLGLKKYDNFKKQTFQFNFNNQIKNLRLTIDYPIDYVVASLVKNQIDGSFSILKLENCWATLPWIFELNKNQIQKKQFRTEKEELIESINVLGKLDFKDTIKVLTKRLNEL